MERMVSNLQHHHHPLLRVDDGETFTCNFCCMPGTSTRYRCHRCDHNVHPFCAYCPQIVSSHLHHHALKLISGYKCKICNQSLRAQSLDYACDSCNVFAHISCIENVKATNQHHDLAKQIMYRVHKHPLKLADKPAEYTCGHCRGTGSGKRYVCKTLMCTFQVHTLCAREPPQSLRSAIHPQHELKLGCWRMELKCQTCFESVGGAFYACKDCGFAIHPSCHEKSIAGGDQDDARHQQHPDGRHTQPREFDVNAASPRWPEVGPPPPTSGSLCFFMHPLHDLTPTQWGANPSVRQPCAVCGDQATGDCYSCFACGFDVHMMCAFTRPTTVDAAHPVADHTLHYLPSREKRCVMCGRECSGWRYYCGLCDVDIHKDCLRGFPPVDSSSSTSGPGYSGASAPYSYGFEYPR